MLLNLTSVSTTTKENVDAKNAKNGAIEPQLQFRNVCKFVEPFKPRLRRQDLKARSRISLSVHR